MATSTNPSPTGTTPSPEKWNRLAEFVTSLGEEVQKYKDELQQTKNLLAASNARSSLSSRTAKPNKPSLFSGKIGTIEAWCSHMDAYLVNVDPAEAFQIACTYLDGEAFTWWHTCSNASAIPDWASLRSALIRRFSPLNKVQAARDKLHHRRQIKDVGSLNQSFLSIILGIPDITESKKVDQYSYGLKRSIWEPLYTNEYSDLESLMTDALRVGLPKRPAELTARINTTQDVPAPSVPPSTCSPFVGPTKGLLLSTASVNGQKVRVLFDDGAPINFISWSHARMLRTNTKKTVFAADMPDGRAHVLYATDALDIKIGAYQEELPFSVCDLSRYDVVIGKRWREDNSARVTYKTNKITILYRRKRITITASLEKPSNLISRQRLTRDLKQKFPAFAIFLHGSGTTNDIDMNSIGVSAYDLPPKRSHEFHIQFEEGFKPHRSGIYRLAESKLVELKT